MGSTTTVKGLSWTPKHSNASSNFQLQNQKEGNDIVKKTCSTCLFAVAATALVLFLSGATSAAPQRGAAAPTPRTVDGHPDLSGYWGPPPLSQNLIAEKAAGPPPTYKPQYQAKVDGLKKNI